MLRPIQKKVLQAMDSKEFRTNMQLAKAVKSKPGPIARCCIALASRTLCTGSNDKGWRRTAAGTKAL